MNPYALVFRSIHDVLAAEKRLQAAGLAVRLIPVPKEMNPNCGMALQIAAAQVATARELLRDSADRLLGVYEVNGAVFTPLEVSS